MEAHEPLFYTKKMGSQTSEVSRTTKQINIIGVPSLNILKTIVTRRKKPSLKIVAKKFHFDPYPHDQVEISML